MWVSRRFQEEHFAPKHVAVIFLRVADDDGVLLRAKVGVGRHLAVALQIIHFLAPERDQFPDDGIFAGRREAEAGGVTIGLDLLAEMFEATVMLPRAPGRFRIDLVEIIEHRFDRGMQAVEIESVESAFPVWKSLVVVVLAQPADEIEHIGVAPHPLRETFETAQRFHAVDVVAFAMDEPIDRDTRPASPLPPRRR